ncbi:MAG: glycyl-radical enzyme activating protein [Clostridiales bacterium]|nr:glycyl-radical enzyme activating protein [Clostridiales bacterium]
MTGTIYNIQRFSIHDGPGIRTTIFFKGCNLRCLWCHNPESISFQKEVEIYQERCIGCGNCIRICPQGAHYIDETGTHHINRSTCDGCLKCADNCFAEALMAVGTVVSVENLMKSILTDLPYYENSGGGVTFSGGECMAQVDFLREVLRACKEQRIHTAVDTAGNVPWVSFEKIIDYTDLFLYDLKAADSNVHKRLTGSGNALIVDNLRRLCAAGKQVFVRIPYIPGNNDAELVGMIHIMEGMAIDRVEIIPYHRLGESKYKSLDIGNEIKLFALPTEQEIQNAIGIVRTHGINAVKA